MNSQAFEKLRLELALERARVPLPLDEAMAILDAWDGPQALYDRLYALQVCAPVAGILAHQFAELHQYRASHG